MGKASGRSNRPSIGWPAGSRPTPAIDWRRSATADDRGVDRLFRHLVPDVTGRRSGHEIINRSCGSGTWTTRFADPGRVSARQFHAWPSCADRRGRTRAARSRVPRRSLRIDRRLGGLGQATWASTASTSSRVELDLGFGRGIGFYTQMIFELSADTARGPSRSAAAAGTTAWRACWAAIATTAAWASPSDWSACEPDQRPATCREPEPAEATCHHRRSRRDASPRRSTPGDLSPRADQRPRRRLRPGVHGRDRPGHRTLGLGHVVTVGRTIEV